MGEEVSAFEQEFAAYCGTSYAVAVNSGASALHLALLAAGVGPGDEVITTPFTFVATVAAILYTGARPVCVDIAPDTYTLDPEQVAATVTSRTRAILPVHLYGQATALDPLLETAQRHGLKVIEDAAQAHGASYRGRRVGGIGDLGCFSFYLGKNLGACGEGGCVTTQDPALARKLRLLRDWGSERRYEHLLPGFNARMDALQGAVLRIKLSHLDAWTEARRAHATAYHELLGDLELGLPGTAADCTHVFHLYVVRIPAQRRDTVYQGLHARGIQAGLHYPCPVHLQPAYASLGYHPGDFPHAERAAREVLSLPLFPELTADERRRVAEALHELVDESPFSGHALSDQVLQPLPQG